MIPLTIINQAGAGGLRNENHRIAGRILRNRPDRLESRLFRRDEFVNAQFIVVSAARPDTYRTVIAENQPRTVPFLPLPENPSILEAALLLAQQLYIRRFHAGKRTAPGMAGKYFFPHLLQFFFRKPPQGSRIEQLLAQARTGGPQHQQADEKTEQDRFGHGDSFDEAR